MMLLTRFYVGLSPHMLVDRPAHHLPAEQVDGDGQVRQEGSVLRGKPALGRRHVGEVACLPR